MVGNGNRPRIRQVRATEEKARGFRPRILPVLWKFGRGLVNAGGLLEEGCFVLEAGAPHPPSGHPLPGGEGRSWSA